MASGVEVMNYLRPNGGWVVYDDEFETIIYDEGVKPVTKKEFTDAFLKIDEINAKAEAEKAQRKNALLERLGITEEEAKLLLS